MRFDYCSWMWKFLFFFIKMKNLYSCKSNRVFFLFPLICQLSYFILRYKVLIWKTWEILSTIVRLIIPFEYWSVLLMAVLKNVGQIIWVSSGHMLRPSCIWSKYVSIIFFYVYEEHVFCSRLTYDKNKLSLSFFTIHDLYITKAPINLELNAHLMKFDFNIFRPRVFTNYLVGKAIRILILVYYEYLGKSCQNPTNGGVSRGKICQNSSFLKFTARLRQDGCS